MLSYLQFSLIRLQFSKRQIFQNFPNSTEIHTRAETRNISITCYQGTFQFQRPHYRKFPPRYFIQFQHLVSKFQTSTLNPLQLYSLIFSLPWNGSKLINYIAKKERKLNSSLQFIKTHKQNKRVSINLVESPFSASRSRFRYRTRNMAITSRKRKVGGGKGTKGTVEGEKEILILRLRQRRARRKSARYRASSSDKANRVSCYEISLALNPFSFLGRIDLSRTSSRGNSSHEHERLGNENFVGRVRNSREKEE